MEFTVLMSVYNKEHPAYLRQSLESTLVNQSITPTEMVIVKDGELTDELNEIIDEFYLAFPSVVKIISLYKNVGLAEALSRGLIECKYNLVARMDSDDINDFNRFEKQLNIFKHNFDIDVVGGNIGEFSSDSKYIENIRYVPQDKSELIKMAKRRNPINHVSVMFKKSSVIKAGGYRNLSYVEDYYLWIRMLQDGCNIVNINEILVFVRTGKNMYKRRSNPKIIKSVYILQKKMYELKFIKKIDIIINMTIIILFTFFPSNSKKYLYKWFLRKKPIKLENIT
ncbi:glycosyltransferase [Planococcus sp. N028]|uniref:Glycosyltransferase n=1 Tax=Planococcus shixiaomingii TaxID=3058393 RepID=A0ABT8N1A6_9BACL|nr:glycosyltransferase [Planococcus sp. N028]MDN7241678.1 glycosyltransferase [Planococcus sp. N028]